MFRNVGSNIYQPAIVASSGSSATEGSVDPSCSKISSVNNTAVSLTRSQLPDVCQIISDGEEIFTSYSNFKKLDYDFFEESKWETTRCSDFDNNQISALYNNARIFIETEVNGKPEFIHVDVFPSIPTDIKFDSLEHLFSFVEQREDAASAREAEAQVIHSISDAGNSIPTGRE